ncbi:MAG TPA: c-type cytochrome [Candidatus Acidoferrum sp.]|nr:c-type cytochrome [Candidatus Acidoferrum sp.]
MRIGKVALAVAVVFVCGELGYLAAQTPAAQTPAAAPQQAPARGGRGGRAGAGTAPPPNFPEQQRQLASPDVIARGKAVFGVNCVPCHGSDLRGGDLGGPNLVRSQLAMSDQHGELIAPIIHGARQDKGMPAFNLSDADAIAVAEYIHSVLAATGAQGRPPGAPDGDDLKVIVGDPIAGKVYFDKTCTKCHSLTGDLKGIGATYSDARTLQNTWVAGTVGGRGGQAGPPTTVAVTLANGTKVEGNLVRKDDFVVTLIEADGTRRTFSRNADVKDVEVSDPHDAHKTLEMALTDKDMHDVTAYLATVK